MGYSSTDFILSLHEAPYADEFASWLKNNFRYETEKKEMNALRPLINNKDDLLQKYYTEASSCLERIKEISADDYLLNDNATTLLTDAEGNGYKYEFYPLTPHAFLATMCAMLSAHMILGVHDNLANVNRTRKLYSLMQRLNPASAKEFARILARYDGYRDIIILQDDEAQEINSDGASPFVNLINAEKLQAVGKTKEELLARLHELIDDAIPATKGHILCKAQLDGFLTDVPNKAIYSSEFKKNGNAMQKGKFESIRRVMSPRDIDSANYRNAQKYIIF